MPGNYACGFIFLVTLLVSACHGGKKPVDQTVISLIPMVSEEELVIRCAPWFIDSLEQPGEIQHNEVINLIIDRHWDLQMSESALFYHIIRPGDGPAVAWGDRLVVHYTVYDTNLQPLDSSHKRRTPFEFYLGNVIQGWNEGLPLIRTGGRILLLIPAYKAYGEEGLKDLIPPGSHLLFDIEILRKIEEN
jgi:hypothetical protein